MRAKVNRGWSAFRQLHGALQAIVLVGILFWSLVIAGGVVNAVGGGAKKAGATPATTSTTATSRSATTERHLLVLAPGQPDVNHPSPTLTPGDVFTDVSLERLCTIGYTSSVRNVSESVRNDVFNEYGLPDVNRDLYEVDHLVSLELGGSNDIKNLWPQPLNGADGAKDKDTVENNLHDLVCSHEVSLADAQAAIVHWDTVNLRTLVSTTSTSTTTTLPPTTLPPTLAPVTAPAVTPPPVTSPPTTQAPTSAGNGATALCNDGTYSYAAHHQGACSHHGGVAVFYR